MSTTGGDLRASIKKNYKWDAAQCGMYTPAELTQLKKSLKDVTPDTAGIVLASWENPWAVAGGLFAVTREYSKHLRNQSRNVHVVSPWHGRMKQVPPPMTPASVFWADFEYERHRVEICSFNLDGVPWHIVYCKGFFEADGGNDGSNPYLYKSDVGHPLNPRLLRDGLFFCSVLPSVLRALQLTENVVAHLQDWETAAAAVTIKDAILQKKLGSVRSVITIHNPYDNGLTEADWKELTPRQPPQDTSSTILGRTIPLLDGPPATVSREFAIDLTNDPLQTKHFAPHLQPLFQKFGIFGVDNGPFGKLQSPFSKKALENFDRGDIKKILQEKKALRKKMIAALKNYQPKGCYGKIALSRLPDDVPVFMCVGRLDPGQKGFDVAARAIEIVLAQGLDARFVLTPISGNAPAPFIADLEKLGKSKECEGKVIVVPFRMAHGYPETQAGCTFSLWPSMYEPFGAVSEFFLKGTPVVGRKTGGLRQQVTDISDESGRGNGILYETAAPTDKKGDNWTAVQNSLPADRMAYPLYQSQVKELAKHITIAAKIFREDKPAYARLLRNAFNAQEYSYNWDRTMNEYHAVYDSV